MYREFPVSIVLQELTDDNLLPAILFRSARKQCDADVESVADETELWCSDEYSQQLETSINEITEKYNLDREVIEAHSHYSALLKTGVGAHHAGQLLVWRLLLEELMNRGLLRLLVATGTVAAGVDFPARTVVITAHSKRGTEGFSTLSAAEFQQMSGRAGRRGKDAVGICLIAPGQYCDARVIADVSKRPPEPLRSAYFAAPATVLNLLKHRSADELRYTVSKSLAAFLDRKQAVRLKLESEKTAALAGQETTAERRKKTAKRSRKLLKDAENFEQRQLNLLERSLNGLETLGHIEAGGLTDKGIWAAELCTSLVLELAEGVDSQLFVDADLETLVGLVGSIAGDAHRPYFALRKCPIASAKFNELEKLVEKVAQQYQGSPFASEVKVQSEAATTVLTWMTSTDWSEFSALLRLSGVAEGDVARLISQTADHLNQLARLTESHPELAKRAAEGRSLLLRPPITDAYEVP